jgi:hypothetical protein
MKPHNFFCAAPAPGNTFDDTFSEYSHVGIKTSIFYADLKQYKFTSVTKRSPKNYGQKNKN